MIDQATVGATPSTGSNMTLSLTFQGPFLFDFKGSPPGDLTVDVFAPYCPFHEAGFFFGDDAKSETDMWTRATGAGPRRYFIEGNGIKPGSDVPGQIYPVRPPMRDDAASNDPILKPNPEEKAAVVPDKVMFQVTVPRPWLIYPLYCDVVEVVRKFTDPPTHKLQIYGTGLRFLYPWDTSSPIYLYGPGTDPYQDKPGSLNVYEITPTAAGTCPALPDYGAIDIRYQGIELEDRNDRHSDARACFANLAVLAGLNEWWLNYEDGRATPSNPSRLSAASSMTGVMPRAHTGGDCGASVIALGLPIANKP